MSSFLNGFVWDVEESFDPLFQKEKIDLKKISSLEDLSGFVRISHNALINKAQKDLWKVEEDDEGNLVIYRLFDSTDSEPLKV